MKIHELQNVYGIFTFASRVKIFYKLDNTLTTCGRNSPMLVILVNTLKLSKLKCFKE